MLGSQIQLWTIHRPEFSIIEGCIDHSKSEYYQSTPGVRSAYAELWQRLKLRDGQVLWCYTQDVGIPVTSTEKIKWELCVPGSEVITFIDDIVWNRILGIKCRVRSDLFWQWRKESQSKYPYDPEAARAYEKDCFNNFWNEEPKSGSWWDELFVGDPGEYVSALIKHPVPTQWVSKRTTIQFRPRRKTPPRL
jgi:hypothetical protein